MHTEQILGATNNEGIPVAKVPAFWGTNNEGIAAAKIAVFYTSTYVDRYIASSSLETVIRRPVLGKHREVYHDQSECQHGKEIKRDGNDVPGTGGHPHCKRCIELET